MPNDMLYTLNIHNMFKTCITWTQNMFRYHKIKKMGAKGRLRGKITIIIFLLIAFTILGQSNIFHMLHKEGTSLSKR
jgi:hypothetical protein